MSQPRPASTWLVDYAVLAPIVFFLIAVVLHLLRTDYDPLRHPMSDYAVGPYGGLMAVAFVVFGSGALALAAGLVRGGPPSPVARIGIGFLVVCGLGLFVAAFFPTDLPGHPATRTGLIHIIDAQINLVSVTLAALCLSLAARRDPFWRPYALPGLLLALAVLAAVIGWFCSPNAIFGLVNKLFVVLLLSWFLLTAAWLRRAIRR